MNNATRRTGCVQRRLLPIELKYRQLINTFTGLAFAGLVACVMLYGAPVLAADATAVSEPTPVPLPEHLTQEDVRDLMARLSDDQVRALLIQQLDKVAQAEKSPAPSTLGLRDHANLWLEQVEEAFSLFFTSFSPSSSPFLSF